jgi:hypothetical protein
MAVTIDSIRNVGLQPALSLTIPIKIWPRILPKPAIPSIMPDTVARAF